MQVGRSQRKQTSVRFEQFPKGWIEVHRLGMGAESDQAGRRLLLGTMATGWGPKPEFKLRGR
ncbi:hypothetical protein EBR78_05615 [bacterium]|nr:hypothetical protein [bacterium]